MDSLKKIEYINNTPTPTQGWQRCPICEGTGIYQGQGTFHEIPTCPTCNGKRIISTLTGLPPQ
jgi:DnaJ-class molecular chaperone